MHLTEMELCPLASLLPRLSCYERSNSSHPKTHARGKQEGLSYSAGIFQARSQVSTKETVYDYVENCLPYYNPIFPWTSSGLLNE